MVLKLDSSVSKLDMNLYANSVMISALILYFRRRQELPNSLKIHNSPWSWEAEKKEVCEIMASAYSFNCKMHLSFLTKAKLSLVLLY